MNFINNIKKGGECYMPIRALNSFSNDWKIKARITKRGELRSWNNQKSKGQLLGIDLVDKDGTAIQATFFNDAAIKYSATLQTNKVYIFSNGSVKMANKRFTSIKNDFSLTFDLRAQIEDAPEDREI